MPKLYQQSSNLSSQGMKFSVTDACDRIKDELSHLQQQLHSLKMEYEKVVQEKSDMQRQYVMYYEITCGLNVEMHRQAELAKRYGAILAQILPFLTQEHQSQVAAAMERAKQNMDDTKLPKISNSPFPGMNPGNMDMYKMMASMGGMNGLPGMPPISSGNMGSSARGGSNSQNSNSNNNGLPSLNSPSSLPFNSNNNPNPMNSHSNNSNSNNPAAAMAQAMAMLAASSSSGSNSMGNNPLMNPVMALSVLMNDKNMDDKQKQSAASSMAAALASAASNNQMGQMSNQNQMIAAMMAASAANSQNLDPSQISNLMSALAASGQMGPSNSNNAHTNRHSNSGPDEKRRKINDKITEEQIKSEADLTVDEQKIRNHFENGDKSEMSNRSRTSTPNHLSSNSNSRRQFLSTPTPTSHVSNPCSRPSSANEAPRTASNPAQCLPDFNLPLDPNQAAPGFTKFNKPLSVDANHHSATPPPPSLGAPLMTNSGRASVSQCTTPTGQNQPMNSGQNTPNSVTSNPSFFEMRNRAPYSFVIRDENPPVPLPMAPELFTGPGLPKSLKKQTVLEHGEVVCAVTLSPSSHQIFTGGRGAVKIWDASFLDSVSDNNFNNDNEGNPNGKFYPSVIKDPLFTMDALNKENYIRSMKLPKDGKTIIVGGEANVLSIWDLGGGNPLPKGDLKSLAPACYALYISPDGKLCYSCCSDGCIAIWDIHNQNLVHQFNGHTDGASCIDGSGDIIWTGGLDKQVCSWDIRKLSSAANETEGGVSTNPTPLHRYNFPSQVFSLGCNSSWVAVGLEAKLIEVISPDEPQSYQLNLHDSCVLSLKFANSSEWFVSTGKDHTINTWRTPYGANLCQVKESSSVLSCDISSDDRYLITGSGERRATIYEVMT